MAQLIVALDYTNAEDALATAESLRGCPIWMKVGLELFTHEGPAVAKKLKDMDFKVMLDLKMFDIPNTVAGGVRSACLMGVDLITLHALGGERMIHAAVDAVRQSAEEGGPKPLLFAVTVLTSMAPGELPGYGENLSGLPARSRGGRQAWGLTAWSAPATKSKPSNPLPRPDVPDARYPPGIRLRFRRPSPHHDARAGRAHRQRFPRRRPPHHQGPRPRRCGPGHSGRDGKGVNANGWEGEGNPSLEGAPPLPTPHPLPSQDFRARYPACLHMRERADRNPSH